jgi:anti-sigma B factor antagonist
MALLDGTEFRVTSRATDGEVVVSVFGEVDMATAPELMATVRAALDVDGQRVVLDLANMAFIDSQGLKVLVDAYTRAREGRADRVVLRSPQPQARLVVEVTGLDKFLTIED